MNFEWVGEEITFYDKKAQIRAPLQYAAIPHQSSPSMRSIEVINIDQESDSPVNNVAFQIASVQALEKENDQELNKIDPRYQEMIQRFPDLLKANFTDEPNKQGVTHMIRTDGSPPCRAKPRKLMPGSPREVEGKKAFQQLIDLKIVEPVDVSDPCTWSSALHLQQKPSGGFRPVGDFRELNSKTELDKFPLPVLRDFSQKLRNAKVFSRVDMKLAFHHIDVAVQDRHKTTTLTPWGAYQWRKLPMGLANAAQSYQRWMSAILGDMEHVFCYLDDFLIYTETEEKHMHR